MHNEHYSYRLGNLTYWPSLCNIVIESKRKLQMYWNIMYNYFNGFWCCAALHPWLSLTLIVKEPEPPPLVNFQLPLPCDLYLFWAFLYIFPSFYSGLSLIYCVVSFSYIPSESFLAPLLFCLYKAAAAAAALKGTEQYQSVNSWRKSKWNNSTVCVCCGTFCIWTELWHWYRYSTYCHGTLLFCCLKF